ARFEESVKHRFGPSKYEDPWGALSKLLQLGTVEDYQREFEKLMNRVMDIPNSLLISFYISELKLNLQHELLVSRPTMLGDAFSLARIIDARFEAIAKNEKEHIIKKKTDVILPLQSELASPNIKGSLNADEDIGVDDVSSAIDVVFYLGDSNVESMGRLGRPSSCNTGVTLFTPSKPTLSSNRLRLDVLKFSRDDPDRCIFVIKEYFSLLKTPTDKHLWIAEFYLEGAAVEWFRWIPTMLGDAFSLARIIEARFEAIAKNEKEHIIKKKTDVILPLQSELASPIIKGSLNAEEDIGVDDVSSAIDVVFYLGDSNVENKDGGCNSKKIMGSQNQDNFFRYHFEDKVGFEGVKSVTPVLQEDGRPKRLLREKSKPVLHQDYVI
nr:retrotransposon Gag protein [Tanacetum cinerariifolium]